MINKELFDILLQYHNYPLQESDYLYSIFCEVMEDLKKTLKESAFSYIENNPIKVIDYLVNEHLYKIQLFSKEIVEKIESSPEYKIRLKILTRDKFIINEYKSFTPKSLINKYNPIISTPTFLMNRVLEKINEVRVENDFDSIILNSINKIYLLSKSIFSLLLEGAETEAFATWRTMHEVECTTSIIFKYPYLSKDYMEHIYYNTAFRDELEDKEEQAEVIQKIKVMLKDHNLKVKDLKKYIEYGWMYHIENQNELYPDLKLNFRKGLEYVAGLTKYSLIYEISSEIAHASPLLIYSKKEFFRDIAILATYETFLRMESLLFEYLKTKDYIDLFDYETIREGYLDEMKMILEKQQLLFKTHYQFKDGQYVAVNEK